MRPRKRRQEPELPLGSPRPDIRDSSSLSIDSRFAALKGSPKSKSVSLLTWISGKNPISPYLLNFRGADSTGRRAKPGRFGSLAFALKNRHFGGERSPDTSRESTKMRQILGVCVCPKPPGKQSIWRQRPPSARKQSTDKLPNCPGFTHVQIHPQKFRSRVSEILCFAVLPECHALGFGGESSPPIFKGRKRTPNRVGWGSST